MNFYRYAVWSGILSMLMLVIIMLSPRKYYILEWKDAYLQAGFLFPVLLLVWLFATIALALNFIYIERLHMQYYFPQQREKKYLPALFCIPSFMSFLWFCYQLCVGI